MSVIYQKDAQDKLCPMKRGSNNQRGCDGKSCMAWREVEPGKGFCGLVSEPWRDLPLLRTATGLSMLLGRGDK